MGFWEFIAAWLLGLCIGEIAKYTYRRFFRKKKRVRIIRHKGIGFRAE